MSTGCSDFEPVFAALGGLSGRCPQGVEGHLLFRIQPYLDYGELCPRGFLLVL